MKKNEKIILQCADCGHKHKKTIKWLENASHLECDDCDTQLDVEEIMDDIEADPSQPVYKAYPR